MERVLVTGGAGFIGSHLVDSLLADGLTVTTLDNFDDYYDRSIKERNIAGHRRHPRWRLIEADLCDRERLTAKLTDPGEAPFDVIVHLAARTGVRPSIENPLSYQAVNVEGTQNLLEAARARGVRQFVFASSSSVYGVNPRVPWQERDHVLQPISPYASTKVSGELLGHVYSYLYGIRFIALRLFTVYGPRQRPDLAIHKFARRMLAGQSIPVFGDGSTRRDYTFVGDIVSGVRAAMIYDRSPYEVVNLGNNRTLSLIDMIHGLEEALGVRAIIDWQPEHLGDVPQTWADITQARELLGYRPATNFPEGVARFIEWLRASDGDHAVVAASSAQTQPR